MSETRPSSGLPAIDAQLEASLHAFDIAFTISDPNQAHHPIVFASSKFYELTGYAQHEVLGRNCRFLQGPETERRKVTEIRDAIREHRPCQVCILNYKKNAQRFWNQFYLSPLHNEAGQLVHYVGIQADVTAAIERRASVEADANNCQVLAPVAVDGLGLPGGILSGVNLASLLDVAEDGSYEVAEHEGRLAAQIQGLVKSASASGPTGLPAGLPCSLLLPLLKIQQSFVLSDPRLPDMPIVHVSDKFLQLTEYPREQVVGRNCRFLQGPGTDPAEVARLRDAVTASPPRPITVRLLNYTASGRPFWNLLHVAPVRAADGAVMFFAGIQLDVTDAAGATPPAAAGAGADVPPAPAVTMTQKMAHQGVTGAIRVAVRALGGEGGLRRSVDHQAMPRSIRLMNNATSCPPPEPA